MKPTFAVLVVDTDAPALAGLVDLLRGAGYKATGAPTFEAARELLETAVFDLLMTDLRLMTHNGLHLVVRSRILQRAPTAIVLSSVPNSVDEAEARRLGASYLARPVDPATLLAFVSKTLYGTEYGGTEYGGTEYGGTERHGVEPLNGLGDGAGDSAGRNWAGRNWARKSAGHNWAKWAALAAALVAIVATAGAASPLFCIAITAGAAALSVYGNMGTAARSDTPGSGGGGERDAVRRPEPFDRDLPLADGLRLAATPR
jgi:CheY-like chemotaxis protein